MRLHLLSWAILAALVACSDAPTKQTSGGEMVADAGDPDADLSPDADTDAPTDAAPGEALFDRERLVQVEVELSEEDWALIRAEGRGLTSTLSGCQREYDYTYVSARVSVDGQTYEDVAVRKKGFMGSLATTRPSLKLNFGRLVEGRTHDGMKRMTLNNNQQDPSNTHQCMAYALFERAGVPAPRCNFARVTVNGEDLGIYTHVESIKKPMLARHFEDNGGNLYEGQATDFIAAHRESIELKTNEEENDRGDFDRLSAALTVSDEELLDELGLVLDLDAFFTFWAMEVMTGHWDSYSGGRNNYLAYHDPTSDRFFFLPWGTDGAFSVTRPFTPENTAATVLAQGLVAKRLYNHPLGRTMYFDRLRELFEQVWDETALLAEADRIQQLTSAPQAAVDAQKDFILSHGEAIRTELELAPVEWVDGNAPAELKCRDELVTMVSGNFSTLWGGAMTSGEEQNLDIQLNMEPWMPAELRVSSDDMSKPGFAQVRFISPQPAGGFIVLALSMPMVHFTTGQHPMHGFETNGLLGLFNRNGPTPFTLVGVIGEGTITLDEASTEAGGAVSGSFEGRFLQMQPL